jgi:hypothetical protein
MQFERGNKLSRGRPKGSCNRSKQEFAEVCREILDEHRSAIVERLLACEDPAILLQLLRFLADRGFGRPPLAISAVVSDSWAPDAPQTIIMRLSNQPIPNVRGRDERDLGKTATDSDQ